MASVEYVAGLIDGEGWIGITQRSRGGTYTIDVKVSMSDMGMPALRALEATLGGKAIPDREAADTRRPSWRWSLSGKRAATALRVVAPHLLVKREQARIALQLMEMVESAPMGRGGGAQWSPEMLNRAELLRNRIKHLNRRGPDPELPQETPVAIYRWGAWWEPEDDLFGVDHLEPPATAVAGCIHDTYPMIASCTPIQTSTTVPAMKALTRARRDRMKTAIAANENTPPTTTKRIKLGMK